MCIRNVAFFNFIHKMDVISQFRIDTMFHINYILMYILVYKTLQRTIFAVNYKRISCFVMDKITTR